MDTAQFEEFLQISYIILQRFALAWQQLREEEFDSEFQDKFKETENYNRLVCGAVGAHLLSRLLEQIFKLELLLFSILYSPGASWTF